MTRPPRADTAMLHRQKEWFSIREIARMTGYSKRTIARVIAAGRLKASRGGPVGGGFRSAFRVHRAELVRWLVASGAPTETISRWLNPGQWVLLVACEPGVQAAIGGRTRLLPTLFHLGQEILHRPAWAAVVDLPAVGTAEACRSLAGLAARPDRPRLIGLFDDTEGGVDDRAARVFDNLFPRSADRHKLARSILFLGRDTRAIDVRDPP